MSNRRAQSFIQLGLFAAILIVVNVLANIRIGSFPLYKKWDLTEEKRFTLTDGTKRLLRNLDEVVSVEILLDGKFPAGFKRLQTATLELLEDFRSESGYIEYFFDDPNEISQGADAINQRREALKQEGIFPTRLNIQNTDGRSEQYIYPWAKINYKGRTVSVSLLENQQIATPEQSENALNNSIALLEYKLADAIQKLQISRKPVVVFTSGHGELEPIQTASIEYQLRKYYDTGRIHLDSLIAISQEASVLVIAKPTRPFSDKDKFKLDQYIMNGGKVLWLVDNINVSLDSLMGRKMYAPIQYDLNLEDLLFNYGVRLEPNLVLDIQSSMIPLQTGMQGGKPQMELFPYPYHLVITSQKDHSISKSVGPINLMYTGSIDTSIQTRTPIQKTVVLSSTPNTRLQYLPLTMDFEFLRYELDASKFNKSEQVVGVLLEGIFPSFFRNRVTNNMLAGLESLNMEFLTESKPTGMLVVSDGDIIRNPVNPVKRIPEPLGRNPYDRYQYSNGDFLINAIEYLIDKNGIIEARNKEVKLRLLDSVKASEEKVKWQIINILLPLVFLIIFGVIYHLIRRERFA